MTAEFTLGRNRYELTRERVEKALEPEDPDIVWDLAVYVNGKWYRSSRLS